MPNRPIKPSLEEKNRVKAEKTAKNLQSRELD